jgi:pimeloyl-ACP methyl ester carboxylesterase
MKKLKKILQIGAVLLGLLAIAAFWAVENALPYYGIKPWRLVPAENPWRFPRGSMPSDYGLQGQSVSIATRDSLILSALLIKSNRDSARATVIVLHGISSCKETQLERAKVLADAGYASLLLDLRAHGQSGGEYCTFGFYEKYDIQSAVDTLRAWFPQRPVAVWGASLGGAVALQAMGLDQRFAFGVIESTFDEFENVAVEYGADLMFGVRNRTLTRRVIAKSGGIAHFDPAAVKPVESARRITCPLLFIHGADDDKIPISFGLRNFEAAQALDKQWIVVENGGHNDLWRVDRQTLPRQVLQFLERQ